MICFIGSWINNLCEKRLGLKNHPLNTNNSSRFLIPLMISVQDFAFRGRLVSLLAALLLRVRKTEGLWSEAGGIRRIDHEGVLCLLGRVDLCHVPLSTGAGQIEKRKRLAQRRQA